MQRILTSPSSLKHFAILFLGYYGLIILLVSPIDGANSKIDVPAEIDKFAKKFENIEKPSPEMINAFVDQIQEQCQSNRTIDQSQLRNISKCIDGLFNETALINELQDSIPKGALDNVFRNLCLKWPSVEQCLKPGYTIIEDCWEKGALVNTGVDTMVRFFCGKDNDGALIALFFAEGGLTCVENHGDKIRDCINTHNNPAELTPDTTKSPEELCTSVKQIYDCLVPLKKCNDSTPHNLVTSMVKEVGRVMDCQVTSSAYQVSSKFHLFPYLFMFSITAFILRH